MRSLPGQFYFNYFPVKSPVKTRVVSQFKNIPERAFYDVFYFYHIHAEHIHQLDFEDFLEIKYSYLVSLYHLDKYNQLHKHADELLYLLLNVVQFDEGRKSYYKDILDLKAKAYANEHKLEQAIGVYKSLFVLDPQRKGLFRTFFFLLFQKEYYTHRNRLGFVVLLLIATLLSNAILMFVLDPFYPELSNTGILMRNILCLASFGSFGLIQALNTYKAYDALSQILREKRDKQNGLSINC